VSVSSPTFYPITITDIERLTPDAVAVRFILPETLHELYTFTAGQYLTLRREFDGRELRRCYSLSTAPNAGELTIGVREEAGGRFSGWLNREARAGDTVDTMRPDGRFIFQPEPEGASREILGVAAGSGIAPILGILETLLAEEPQSSAALLYANRDLAHIMFKDRLDDLKDRHLNRLRMFHVLSREPSDVPLLTGRLDRTKCESLFGPHGVAPAKGFARAYICGPEPLTDLVAERLAAFGLAPNAIRRELFLNADSPPPAVARPQAEEPVPQGAEVTVIFDQRRRRFIFDADQPSILDAARAAGADVPFACKAGVCATCRAHLIEGEVYMTRNHALDPDELERGFILTCQARPTSTKVVMNFDRRS